MIRWLVKSTNEYRLETMSDVEQFHQKMQQEAEDGGYTLSAFSWTKREKKEKGEIIDEWFVVKVTFVFNDSKEPENPFTKVEYPYNGDFEPSMAYDSGDVM